MSNANTSQKTNIDQFIENEFGDLFYRNTPLLHLQPMGAFDPSNGYTPNVTRMTHARSTKRLEGVQPIDKTNATPGWDIQQVETATGEDDRSYTPIATSRQSQEVHVEDLRFKTFDKQHVSNMLMTMVEQVDQLNNDFMRVKNWEMSYTKYIPTSATGGSISLSGYGASVYETLKIADGTGVATGGTATTGVLKATDSAADDAYIDGVLLAYEDSNGDPITKYATVTDYVASTKTVTVADWLTAGGGSGTDLAAGDKYVIYNPSNLPVSKLEDAHLQFIHDQLDQMGARLFSWGKAGSSEVYTSVFSAFTKNRIWRDDLASKITETDNNRDLLSIAGIDRAIFGLMPIVDPRNRRYDEDLVEISPTVVSPATRGSKSDFNPHYNPASQGGRAVYEEIWVGTSGLYRNESLNVNSSVSAANFDPQNYLGSTRFLNQKTYGPISDNPLGKKGYFNNEWGKAARPGAGERGIAVLALMEDAP